jgi:hypothetical protein
MKSATGQGSQMSAGSCHLGSEAVIEWPPLEQSLQNIVESWPGFTGIVGEPHPTSDDTGLSFQGRDGSRDITEPMISRLSR